jgi:saccharopine dehydrogenase-like NADP-dependent oxidoreductase
MKKVLVCGAGLVAGPLVKYLLSRPDYAVVVADVEVDRAKKLVAGQPRGEARALSVEDRAALAAEIGRADLIVFDDAVDYRNAIAMPATEMAATRIMLARLKTTPPMNPYSHWRLPACIRSSIKEKLS